MEEAMYVCRQGVYGKSLNLPLNFESENALKM